DRRSIGVIDHVVVEVQIIVDHVLNQCTQQNYVSATANSDVTVRKCGSTCVARIDVNNTSTTLFGFSYPLETHGVRSEEHTSELQSRFDLVCHRLLDK